MGSSAIPLQVSCRLAGEVLSDRILVFIAANGSSRSSEERRLKAENSVDR